MIETTVSREDRIAVHHGKDDICLADFWTVMSDVFKNPVFDPSFSILWDLRKCDIRLSLTEIVALDETVVDTANRVRGSGKTAWLVSTDFAESIIRLLYERYNWTAEWRTFSTFDDAYSWASTGPVVESKHVELKTSERRARH